MSSQFRGLILANENRRNMTHH